MKILFLVLRVLLGLLFLAAGLAKAFGVQQMVDEFGVIGLGQWFRYATAGCEIVGALLLIRLSTATLGAGLLACVSLGALVAQVAILHGDPIHCLVLAALAGWVAWNYRGFVRT